MARPSKEAMIEEALSGRGEATARVVADEIAERIGPARAPSSREVAGLLRKLISEGRVVVVSGPSAVSDWGGSVYRLSDPPSTYAGAGGK